MILDRLEVFVALLAGLGILIEKSYQGGRKKIEEVGIPVCSLARIGSLDAGQVDFLPADL